MSINTTADVIVAGAGPAGAMAAIAAARKGADTLLIERSGCAGGIWTSGLLSWMLDVTNKGGILKELCARIESADEGYYARFGNFITFPESVKLTLEEMFAEAGVRVLYYTQVTGCEKEGNRLTKVITQSKAGRIDFTAKQFVDATGDGDLAALAGCSFEMGKPGDGGMQPASLIALMTGVDPDEVREYNNTLPYLPGKSAKERMFDLMNGIGITPSYRSPSFFHIKDGIWLVMTVHAYGVNPLDPESLTRATIENRAELKKQEEALRALGGPWKNMRIVETAPYIGIREARRIKGKYTVTVDDAIEGKKHEDAVCTVQFELDVHPLLKDHKGGEEHRDIRTKPYDIPLRALESADIENLLLAGRLISGDFLAHSSYRVSGDAAALGEAAGAEAARRVLTGEGIQ